MTITRAEVVTSHVQPVWLRTTEIAISLEQAGYPRSVATVLDQLKYLVTKGLVERRQIGRAYEWRTAPEPEAPTAEARDALAILDELRTTIERVQVPQAAPVARANEVFIGSEAALGTLVPAQRDIVDRIVERASYVALRTMLKVLDGWIEGNREAAETLGRGRDVDPQIFHAEDIRRMVNDAAREVGAREPYGG